MKTKLFLIYAILLVCGIVMGVLQAQEDQSVLFTQNLEVYPEEIYYGDIFFNRIKVQNNMEKTRNSGLGSTSYGTSVLLKQNEVMVYYWLPHYWLNMLEVPTIENEHYWRASNGLNPFREVHAHTTESVLIRPLWFPMPEFSDSKAAQELEAAVSAGQQLYLVELPYWKNEPGVNFTCPITVKPRPKEDYELLRKWYYELPTTRDYAHWTEDAVFAHPFYVRGSPRQTEVFYRMDQDTRKAFDPFRDTFDERILLKAHTEARKKLNPLPTTNDSIAMYKAYIEFFEPLRSRTPETLARIKRTNELAAKIIERSKQPDSTFSRNMVEFIQLRGLLVDMRYAENEEAEEAALIKMMDFVDASQDKELWIDFLYDLGLNSIENHTYFPYAKVFEYRQRFAERMKIKNLCRSFEDYHRIYGFGKKTGY